MQSIEWHVSICDSHSRIPLTRNCPSWPPPLSPSPWFRCVVDPYVGTAAALSDELGHTSGAHCSGAVGVCVCVGGGGGVARGSRRAAGNSSAGGGGGGAVLRKWQALQLDAACAAHQTAQPHYCKEQAT